MEKLKQPVSQRRNPAWLIIGAFLIFFLAIGGQSVRLTCKRTRQAGSVNCLKEIHFLWVIPMRTTKVSDVRGAQVGESYGEESGDTYRVELLTGHGMVPLTKDYTSGPTTKRDLAEKINAFVQSTTEGSLEVTEPGLLSLENIICVVIWLPIAYLANAILGGAKSLFGAGKNR